MASPKSVPSQLEKNSIVAEREKRKNDIDVRSSSFMSSATELHGREANQSEDFIGVLDVYIHQARDIHNICIYHKQDVYAKLCLTSDPENAVSTQIINGGGKNPVFNQNLRLNVRTANSSLKCEIWMLSRVRNYLEDQLLGFSLVPVTEVILKNGKLEKEFSLSSTDLFHSPAGFVQLSLSYVGSSPDIIAIHRLPATLAVDSSEKPSEITDSAPGKLDRIEFPDPVLLSENQIMVSEYFELSHAGLGAESPVNLGSLDSPSRAYSEIGASIFESSSAEAGRSIPIQKQGYPPSSFSTEESPPPSSQPPNMAMSIEPPKRELVAYHKEKSDMGGDEGSFTSETPGEPVFKPLVGVNIDPEEKVVQQDIVDLYMKSMQQFTESLAKMKLPMDLETEASKSPEQRADQKLQTSKSPNSRVFYGSRAFF